MMLQVMLLLSGDVFLSPTSYQISKSSGKDVLLLPVLAHYVTDYATQKKVKGESYE